MTELFGGMTLLEFGGGAAGPVATRYFADHGATVIRVESKQRPDFLRILKLTPNTPGGIDSSEHFAVLNANKLSVALNLSKPEGVAVARRLALRADCIAENFAPGAMAKWGLDYATLVRDRPDLVMISTCLNGQTGPQRFYPGFGGQGSALSGFNHFTGWPDREPLGPYGTITDSLSPRFAALLLAAALLHRQRTGQGQHIDLAQVEGTGVHGRVTKQDILAFLERPQAAPAPARAAAPAAATKMDTGFHVAAYGPSENVVVEPMSKIRQITAAHMRYSKDTSAHVTTVFHMDFTKVHNARERAKRRFADANGTKLTYMPFIFKAVCNGLKAHPKLNAAIDGTNVVFKKDINLGMAVALDWGLIVPVIKNADHLNLIGLAKAANDLADRARAKKLVPDEVKGGTFTITNPGVFGSLFGTPVINQPQVAILGVGAIEKRPVVVTDADGCDTIAIRVMSYFGITYDHRLVDGADADRFMNDVKKVLETDPWTELEAYT